MKIYLFFISTLLLITLNPAHTNAGVIAKTDSTMSPANLFTRADAEKILGQNSLLQDSLYEMKEDTIRYKCSYIADSIVAKTGKTGTVYFMFEKYTKVVEACEKYTSTYEANKEHDGVKVIKDVGDEAYSQVTKTFYFIMVRARNKIIVMKVNKLTSKTSQDEFIRTAREISKKLYDQ